MNPPSEAADAEQPRPVLLAPSTATSLGGADAKRLAEVEATSSAEESLKAAIAIAQQLLSPTFVDFALSAGVPPLMQSHAEQ